MQHTVIKLKDTSIAANHFFIWNPKTGREERCSNHLEALPGIIQTYQGRKNGLKPSNFKLPLKPSSEVCLFRLGKTATLFCHYMIVSHTKFLGHTLSTERCRWKLCQSSHLLPRQSCHASGGRRGEETALYCCRSCHCLSPSRLPCLCLCRSCHRGCVTKCQTAAG